ncbi:hypothetical protein KU6B_48160 [Mameliella alba]|uniref:hypothetical protein n=1 Tax=Mameliella alba TaxID=561184 RepID=UPI0013E44BF1|nr:hypothetical protein [Mameliella alba]BBU58551.1 hypothetical protein KU6B_48160 [Mameliella alba]
MTLYVTPRGHACPSLPRAYAETQTERQPSLPKPIRPAPEVLARIMQNPVPRKEGQ